MLMFSALILFNILSKSENLLLFNNILMNCYQNVDVLSFDIL